MIAIMMSHIFVVANGQKKVIAAHPTVIGTVTLIAPI
jgi:hypothetical protein